MKGGRKSFVGGRGVVLRLTHAAPPPRDTRFKAAMQGKSDSKSKATTSLTTEAITHRIAWARHIIALIAGLACGVIGITGFIGIIVFVASNILLVLGYYMYILGVDPEEHGGHGQFTNEALMPALAVFVVRPCCTCSPLTSLQVVLDRLLQQPAERPGVLRIRRFCEARCAWPRTEAARLRHQRFRHRCAASRAKSRRAERALQVLVRTAAASCC